MAIKYLPDGRAKLIVSMGSASRGNRRQRTKIVRYKGKKDLLRQYREFEDQCLARPNEDLTVQELVEAYIDMQRINGLKDTTIKGYESIARRLNLAFAGIKAHDLTAYQINRFIATAAKGDPSHGYKTPSSPKTIKGYISLLRSAYTMAIKNGMLKDNPCRSVTIPKQKKPDIRILTSEELVLFTAALSDLDLDLRVCYELALFCGLRRSEVMGLKFDDVNTTWSTIKLVRTRHQLRGHEDIIQGMKTEQSRGTVAVPAFVMDDIKRLIEKNRNNPYSDCDFLIQRFGEPMRPDLAGRSIKRFTASHGLPDVTMHGLRHTFASMLNASGQFDIAEISAALRHSNISTTLNIYTHLFEDATRSSRRIADFMQKGVSGVSQENEKTAENQ
jgi:integrase